jgi:hypothetical protein
MVPIYSPNVFLVSTICPIILLKKRQIQIWYIANHICSNSKCNLLSLSPLVSVAVEGRGRVGLGDGGAPGQHQESARNKEERQLAK